MGDLRTAGQFPLPDDAGEVPDFVRTLRAVKLWAGDPSLEVLRRRTGVATSTLSDAFNPQRRRMPSLELVRALVRACGADPAQVAQWEQAWRSLRERTDVAASAPPARSPSPTAAAPQPAQDEWIPRQLPPDVAGFVGRTDALDALKGAPDYAPATVLTGTAGVGKTALAVHWAHQIADRYPDGQLYLDLRGHAGDPAIPPAEALSLLLQSLGVSGDRIPVDLQVLMGLYRSVLAVRRVLVVLDNVVDAAHVRPMLPSGPHCHALVTSRDALTGLVVREGAARITLDTLPAAESVELLATHLGAGRVAAEPDAAAELASLCAHLPLALRISAANLAARPSQTIAGTVRELGRTDLLARLQVVGDPESAVAAAFDVSYRSLPTEVQRLFRLLGLAPGPEVSREAAAVLLGRDPADPVPELDELLTANLLFEPSPGRYRTHDLLSLYARRHAADEPESERRDALTRLLDLYLYGAAAAMDALYPAEAHRRPTLPPRSSPGPAPDEPKTALLWLGAERATLVAACLHAGRNGWPEHAVRLAAILYSYLDNGGHPADAVTLHTEAQHAARLLGDKSAEATALTNLGVACWQLGRHPEAIDHFVRGLSLFREAGDSRGEARTLGNLGVVHSATGQCEISADYHRQALDRFVQLGDRVGEANTLTNLGSVSVQLDQPGPAVEHHRLALDIFRDLRHRGGEATALTNLGDAQVMLGRFADAVDYYEPALDIFRELGERYGETCALNGLGDALAGRHQQDDAIACHVEALRLATEIDQPEEEERARAALARLRKSAP